MQTKTQATAQTKTQTTAQARTHKIQTTILIRTITTKTTTTTKNKKGMRYELLHPLFTFLLTLEASNT